MIYHHIKSLSKLDTVARVFLLGFYEPNKFRSFIDECLTKFPFDNLVYLHEPYPMSTGGGIFYFKDQIMENDP